ncbi:MAG: T9SS type A sorting domain-containing protein [Flavobacteriales bacterium]|nr:T9SS type A sorting domain-containing protein [Flavobacteriales bacterium]
MNIKHTTLALVATALCINSASAQFITRPDYYSPTGLANDGLVTGYSGQTGPWSIWNPDLQTTENIGGTAPGDGAGGQARFSLDGNFISGTSQGPNGAALSRYDRGTGQWTLLGDLGFPVDLSVSGGYAISGDGSTVVGNSWADTTGNYAFTHAVAVDAVNGVSDLGTLFFNRSTRANAVNSDASVVVGWQDFNGPWKSAVWRKDPNGAYLRNAYVLLDPNGDPDDEFNQMGECSAVSSDGTWIGGYGDYANNAEPWIWGQSTGVINLGHLPMTGTGYVGGMNADASVVVGWFDGELWGDPQTAFIWTSVGGLQNLATYMTDEMGIDLGNKQVSVANCLSENGRYVAGYGIDYTDFSGFAYRLDLAPTTGIHAATTARLLEAYPNPTTGRVTINVAGPSNLSILNAAGSVLSEASVQGNTVVDLSAYAPGVYTFQVRSNGSVSTGRIVKY